MGARLVQPGVTDTQVCLLLAKPKKFDLRSHPNVRRDVPRCKVLETI